MIHIENVNINIIVDSDLEEQTPICTACEPEELADIRIEPDITVAQAMNILVKELKENPGYYDGWIANLVMAFRDEVEVDFFERYEENMDTYSRNILKEIANKAAVRFLDNLTR